GFKTDSTPANTATGSGMKIATIQSTTTTGTTSITFSAFTGTVAVGMDVTGTNVPANSHVSSVTYNGSGVATNIVLDTVASGTVTGTITVSTTKSAGTTMTGGFGTLLLNSDGTYTYTPTINNANISQNQTVTETFSYTMQDTS